MKRIILFTICIIASLDGFSQFQTIPFKNNSGSPEGIPYTLPKTVLVVEVTTECTQQTPGPYCQYAERFLGITDVCQTEITSNEIVSVSIYTKPVPDDQNTYLIVQESKSKNPATIELTPEGFLSSINGDLSEKNINKKSHDANRSNLSKPYETMESSIVTREMQQSTSTAKIAELAALELFNIRDARVNILTQDVDKGPSDGKSYELVLSELNRIERYYTELFTGKRNVSKKVTTFEVDPASVNESTLFRFSQIKGIVDKADLGGSPVNIKIQKEGALANNAQDSKNAKSVGLYYRIPGKAKITIADGKKTFCEKEIMVAQFGNVMTLPVQSSGKVKLCPFTGALLQSGN